MTRHVTSADQSAYDTLTEIAAIEDIDALYEGMARAGASYGDMTDLEIFHSDYKEYEVDGSTEIAGDSHPYIEIMPNMAVITDALWHALFIRACVL